MTDSLLFMVVVVLLVIAVLLSKILGALRQEDKQHYEGFDPRKESWEHFQGKSAVLILEEERRGEIWNPKQETAQQFLARGQK